MKQPLLDLPVGRALRRLVRRQMAAAACGLERAQNPDDHKGLHAFRVAIRRQRSRLRAYRRWLGRVAGKKPRRRLREPARATNAARDAHVQLTRDLGRALSGWLFAQNIPSTTRRLRSTVTSSAGVRTVRGPSPMRVRSSARG